MQNYIPKFIVLFVLTLSFSMCMKKGSPDRDIDLTIIDSDRMVSELDIDLDSLFNTEFSTDTWAFELMAEREYFDKKKIFWNASARCPADTGKTWGIIEYQEEGRTAEEATRELMKRMKLATDTIIVRKLGLQ